MTAFAKDNPSVRPHAVVIGSGFGGLAAAIRLGERGYRVTVLEKLEQPGGRARVHRQDGFTFDAGPTIITAPFLLEDLWRLAGRRLADDIDLRAVTPFYRLMFDDGTVFDYSGDVDAMEAQVRALCPDDVAGYRRFMATSEAIYRIAFERLGHVPFSGIMDMVRCIPALVRLRADRTVHGLVARHVRDPRLRVAFSFHPLLVGGNPFSASSVYALIAYLERAHGVHFAIGGTGAVVRGMCDLIRGQGGTVRCDAPVASIMVARGAACGVRLDDGSTIAADVVVSNADPAVTYGKLLPPTAKRRRWTARKLRRARYSMSLFVWYFGTRRRYEDVAHHTIVLGPRYQGLLRDIFGGRLAEDFSLYLHRPTATDPSLAPEGCDAFYVLSPVPHLGSGTDWAAMAEPYRQAIERHLEATLLPGLAAEIVTSKVTTPVDFRDELSSHLGAAFGMEPVLTQSAWFRPHNRSEEVQNLYLVGAGTHPGAGLPGVLSSARVLDSLVADARTLV